jgi:hypothetical protein
MVARYLRTNHREFQTSQFGLANRLSTVLRGRSKNRVVDGQRINSLAINGVSHVASLVGLKNIDVTSSVNSIIGSLERAYDVLEGGYDRVSDQAISLSERLFPGTGRFLKNFSAASTNFSRFGRAGAAAGFSKPSLMIAIGVGALTAYGFASIFALPLLTVPGIMWGVGGFLGSLTTMDIFSNPTRKYIFKKTLYPAMLTIAAFSLRLYMRHEHWDNWYCGLAMLGTVLAGNLLPNLALRMAEPVRHLVLNSRHNNDISVMVETKRFSELLFKAKWQGWNIQTLEAEINKLRPAKTRTNDAHQELKDEIINRLNLATVADSEIIGKLCSDFQRKLAIAVRKVPAYRFPKFFLNAVYESSRIYSTLLYLPLTALFFSRGYDAFTAMLFMMFWMAQLIYGPGGKAMFRHLGVGNLSETYKYGDLPTRGNAQRGEPDTARIPETKLLRLSNRGLFKEGRIPVFLIKDIINCVVTGYRVKIVLDNDSRNLFYPEVAGAVARANQLAARVYIIHKALIEKDAEFNQLPYDKKVLLLRIFMKENLWDPTQDFDHAFNAAVKGSWPNELANQVLTAQGDEAGDKVCGRAMRKILKAASRELRRTDRKLARGVAKAATMVERYATRETRISLYNIFDNEYVELACAEIAQRIYPRAKRQAKRDALTQALLNAVVAHREKYLIEEYHKLIRKFGRSWNTQDERMRFIAQELVSRIPREMKIAELVSAADRLVEGAAVSAQEREDLVAGIEELVGLPRASVERLLGHIENENIPEFATYLSEMPIVPEPLWAKLRDTVLLALGFAPPPRDEDSNLLPLYEKIATTGTFGTRGQQEIWSLIVETVRREFPDQELPKAVHNWLMGLRRKGNKPRITIATNIAQEIESRFRMYRIMASGSQRPSFWILNMARTVPVWICEVIPIFGRVLKKIVQPAVSLVLGMPAGSSERFAFWCQELGREIVQEAVKEQLFSHDYSALMDRNLTRYSRAMAEELVFDKWVKGEISGQARSLRQITDEVVDRQVAKKRLKSGTVEMIKHHVYEVTLDQLDKNRNMVHSVTAGFAWILAREMEGVKFVADQALNNSESRIAHSLNSIIPSRGSAFSPDDFTLKGNSSLSALNGGRNFLDKLPRNLSELRDLKDEVEERLVTQTGGDGDRAKEISKAVKTLMANGIKGFPSAKGYVKNRWELSWEIPGILLGRNRLQFSYWLSAFNQGTLHMASGMGKKYRDLDNEAVRHTLSLMVATYSRIEQLQIELRDAIYGTRNPDLLNGRPVEDFASEQYAKGIVEAFMQRTINDAAGAARFLARDGAKMFGQSFFPEMTQYGIFNPGNGPGHILKNNFVGLIDEAYKEVEAEQMGLLRLEES